MKKTIIFILVLGTIFFGTQGNVSNAKNLRINKYNIVFDYGDFEEISANNLGIEHKNTKITIGVLGDIMFHNTQVIKAYDSTKNEFDFSKIFKYLSPYTKPLDFCLANFETTLAGPVSRGEKSFRGYSGYPCFNTPDSCLDAIKESGIDFLTTANNHCIDKRYNGLVRTIEQLDEKGFGHTGTFVSEELRKPYEMVDVSGVKLAIVSFTYATNGISIGEKTYECINTLDMYKKDRMELLYSDIRKAEDSEADYVVACIHWGYEYQAIESTKYQDEVAIELIKNGADIIWGGHPHVMQPLDIITEIDGEELDEPKYIIYSLGNLISSQLNLDNYNGANTDLGVLFTLDIEKFDDNKPKITNIGLLPTYALKDEIGTITVPVLDDIEPYENELSVYNKKRIDFAKKYTINHLVQYIQKKELISREYLEKGLHKYKILY